MNKIHFLDNNTINKIAAGEVVERPSSVVKELVENSIDANATAITIEIKEGGTSLIKISDNGSGIEKGQVETAFIRHATSKIEKIDDLDDVYTMGFRGEALASIASVSQVEMITKTIDQEEGYKIEISGGNVVETADCAAKVGTIITIKNIFYNVPARRKFLKKPATESSYIADIVNKLALAHPEISIKYINNGNIMLHTSGNNDLQMAIYGVYGKDVSTKMIEVDYTEGDFTITGMIGKPELARGNRNYENLFINRRFVKNEIVSQAVEDAYKTRLMVGKFPVFILNLKLNGTMVDVNVHPAKREVRFRDDDAIYDFVYNSVLEALKEVVLIPQITEEKPTFKPEPIVKESVNKDILSSENKESIKYTPANENLSIEELQERYKEKYINNEPASGKNKLREKPLSYLPDVDVNQEMVVAPKKEIEKKEPPKQETLQSEIPEKELFFKSYKIVGQLFATYWIVEQGNSAYLIDQHAAHERILFEEIVNSFKNAKVPSQRLLQPVALSLTEMEKQILKDNWDMLLNFGFDLEEFGGLSIALKGVPHIFKNPENVGFFTEILDLLGSGKVENLYDAKVDTMATIACKAAVKGNDKLSVQDAVSLIERLLKLENPFNCPHGRPTIVEITKNEFEKYFKRIV